MLAVEVNFTTKLSLANQIFKPGNSATTRSTKLVKISTLLLGMSDITQSDTNFVLQTN